MASGISVDHSVPLTEEYRGNPDPWALRGELEEQSPLPLHSLNPDAISRACPEDS